MGFEDYISETEAAGLAGVSVNTLNRFAEAGYLQIESDSDGLRLFSRRELGDVFGFQDAADFGIDFGAETESAQVAVESHYSEPNGEIAQRAEEPESVQVPPVSKPAVDEAVFRPAASAVDGDTAGAEQTTATIGNIVNFVRPAERAGLPEHGTDEGRARHSKALDTLEREITRLKNIMNMQERLLDLREAEITDLKQQRDWLQSRVERMEEKSDRDQLLLLSETQLIRQMVVNEKKRSSPVRKALEWFGLQTPQEETTLRPGSSVEIKPGS